MTCTDHARENCQEARCFMFSSRASVRTACAEQLPISYNIGTANEQAAWAFHLGYQERRWKLHASETLVDQIAARLVAWIRWPGVIGTSARAGEPLKAGDLYEHPLDTTWPWAARVAMLKVCRHDGTNWHSVAVVCDLLTRDGMWSEVHAWREPSKNALRALLSEAAEHERAGNRR